MSGSNLLANAVAENPVDRVFLEALGQHEPILAGDGKLPNIFLKIKQIDVFSLADAIAAIEKADSVKKYEGMAAYKPKVQTREKLKIGPTKLPANVRISCRFDYQPDLCKDWKETGYCGYGGRGFPF